MKLIHLTSQAYRFRVAIAQGDYHRALGVKEDSRRLEIDVAAARLADRVPTLAVDAAAVASVLTTRERRALYDVVCRLRDEIQRTLMLRHGPEVDIASPHCRELIWRDCCQLLEFDVARSSQPVDLNKAKSVEATGGEQIVEMLVTTHLTRLCCTPAELNAGVAIREIWHGPCSVCHVGQQVLAARLKAAMPADSAGQERPHRFVSTRYQYNWTRCPECGSVGTEPTNYDDTYYFSISPAMADGRLVEGTGQHTGRSRYSILNTAMEWRWPPEERSIHAELKRIADSSARSPSGSSGWCWVAIFVISLLTRVGCAAIEKADRNRTQEILWEQRMQESIRRLPGIGRHDYWRGNPTFDRETAGTREEAQSHDNIHGLHSWDSTDTKLRVDDE